MDKAEFLQSVRSEWERWQALLDDAGAARMTRPGAAGDWSVKDVVAHITFFEREMAGMMRQRALAGSDLWQLDQDRRNQAIYERNRDRPLDEVLAESAQVHRELMEALEELPEEHYGNPQRFRDMPAGWTPWQVLAGNTYLHYREHREGVRKWLDGQATV